MSNIYFKVTIEKKWHTQNFDSESLLLTKNIKFNKNEAESKMENPTHSFREMNHVLQLV